MEQSLLFLEIFYNLDKFIENDYLCFLIFRSII